MTVYTARVLREITKNSGPKSIEVGVFRRDGDSEEQIGSYSRDVDRLDSTFCYFRKSDKDLALYSPSRELTRLMSLPDCRDIGGEDYVSDERREMYDEFEYWPREYYVPCYIEGEIVEENRPVERCRFNEPGPESLVAHTHELSVVDSETKRRKIVKRTWNPVTPLLFYPFGFIAGHFEGCPWTIQYLDLTEAEKGILRRDDRFGYVAFIRELSLRQAIRMGYFGSDKYGDHIEIALLREFELQTGKERRYNRHGQRIDN